MKDQSASGGLLSRVLSSGIVVVCAVACLFCDSVAEREKKRPKTKQRGCEPSHYLRKSLSELSLCLSQTRTNTNLPTDTNGNPNPPSSIKGYHRASRGEAPILTSQEEPPSSVGQHKQLPTCLRRC